MRSRAAMVRRRLSNSGVTLSARGMTRFVLRRDRPSMRDAMWVRRSELDPEVASAPDAGTTDGIVSGAERFELASSAGGGGPRRLRLSLDKSAMSVDPVYQCLNERVCAFIKRSESGFRDGVAGVLGQPIPWPLRERSRQHFVAGVLDILSRVTLLSLGADTIEGEHELGFRNAGLCECMKLSYGRPKIVGGSAGWLHDNGAVSGNLECRCARSCGSVKDQEVIVRGYGEGLG